MKRLCVKLYYHIDVYDDHYVYYRLFYTCFSDSLVVKLNSRFKIVFAPLQNGTKTFKRPLTTTTTIKSRRTVFAFYHDEVHFTTKYIHSINGIMN
jgi:hypothetical protein